MGAQKKKKKKERENFVKKNRPYWPKPLCQQTFNEISLFSKFGPPAVPTLLYRNHGNLDLCDLCRSSTDSALGPDPPPTIQSVVMGTHRISDFIGPLHWFPVATDQIVRLILKMGQGL